MAYLKCKQCGFCWSDRGLLSCLKCWSYEHDTINQDLPSCVNVGSDGSFFDERWTLESNSQDVDATLDYLASDVKQACADEGIGALFILASDGDIDAIYGIVGSVAYTHKTAYRLFPDCTL